jgi:succinate dehydrogenase/fumarate reductase flavoprotein subunit
MPSDKVSNTDVLVIGGGMAGLAAAIKAREAGKGVTLVDKAYVGQAGVSFFAFAHYTVFDPKIHDYDKWLSHLILVGEYVNNKEWLEIILKESLDNYKEILSWGVPQKNPKDEPKWHSAHTPDTDKLGGVDYMEAMAHKKWLVRLREKALEVGVNILDRVMITDLIKRDGEVVGAVGFHTRNTDFYLITAKAVIIATGSGNFKIPGEPWHQWTADGEAASYRAGAEIMSKEFGHKDVGCIKAFPTVPKGVARAHSHRVYINGEGEEYLKEYPPGLHGVMMSALFEVHAGRGPIYLDCDRFTPEDRKASVDFIDSWERGYEVGKAIDYATATGKKELIWGSGVGGNGGLGGIRINMKCQATVPGLYAVGDSAGNCASGSMGGTGLSGAAITGFIAAEHAAGDAAKSKESKIDDKELARLKDKVYTPLSRKGGFSPGYVTEILRNLMVPYYVVQVKHGDRLQATITMLDFMFSINDLKVIEILRDTHKKKQYFFSPLVFLMKMAALASSERSKRKHRYDLTLKNEVILGGNNMIFVTRKKGG